MLETIAMNLAGTLDLIYGGFSFTKETRDIEFGPLSMPIDAKEYVGVAVWAGIVGITISASMLVMGKRG